MKNFEFMDNQIKFKTFLLATLCTAAVLWGCKKDEKDPIHRKPDYWHIKGAEIWSL